MTWRFRKSFSPLPGVRITLSPRGVSTSVGVGPFRATVGPNGPAFNANVPDTGLSFRHVPGSSSRNIPRKTSDPTVSQTQPNITPEPKTPEMNYIESAGSGALTTQGLNEFKRLLEQSHHEHKETIRELSLARTEESFNVKRYTNWEKGFFMRRLFKSKFEQLRISAEESTSKRAELEEQEYLSRLQTMIELPDGVRKSFHRLNDQFDVLANCDCIWDTIGKRSTDRIVERTAATHAVERKQVRFQLGCCELIESEWKVPHLENANGGDVFFYPVFALYFVSSDNFALLEYKDIQLDFSLTQVIEEEKLPEDTTVIGQTWAKANKDSSPDKRFKENYQIPIAQYGKISIKSDTGMNEEYMVSNAEHARAFTLAWKGLSSAIAAGV